ncbi:MAG: ATPase [Lachnospiraceae bacterium]|nr:ATPase [Lachnospiraceae bacterium]
MKEISVKELEREDKDSYILVDIRDEGSVLYGMMPNAISIPTEQFENNMEEVSLKLSKDKKIIVYCQRGENSIKIAERLNDFGFDAYNLKGGFNSFLLESLSKEEESEEYKKSVEESIRKKFHKSIFSPFAKGCKNYELIQEGDHIAVCISGGKDSMLMAKLFQEIQKHKKVSFDLTFLVMDPGYNEQNRALIESNAKKLGIPITIFESDIFDAVDTVEKSPCYLCARMRRGYLYSKAKELGCNKIALGHHYDDVIETILMAMLHGGQIQTMMPKLHSTNFEGMELIRPLYLVREENICKWRDYNNLHFLQCACHFTETCSTCHEDGTTSSKRLETKKLIAKLKENNPYIEGNIFKSVENVNLSTVIAYKKDGVKHNFLEEY